MPAVNVMRIIKHVVLHRGIYQTTYSVCNVHVYLFLTIDPFTVTDVLLFARQIDIVW